MAESFDEYGSVIQCEDSEFAIDSSLEEDDSDSDGSSEVVPAAVNCSCKSQCMRKLKTSASGKVTGCACKHNGVQCGDKCSCGSRSKPCKNRAQPQGQAGASTEAAQHGRSEEIQQNEVSVEEIIDGLDHQTLIKVAKEGFMSRPLVLRDLLERLRVNPDAPHDPDHPHPPSNAPVPFCVCGYCREMPTDKERVCCREKRLCRSRSLAFQNICLDSDNLATAIRSLADTYVFTPIYDNRSMRHSAYRQYIMWIHGHLGKGNRKVISSCCVWAIRKHYPSPNGHYTGFKKS